MKVYSLDNLVAFVIRDLTFSSRVLIMGNWEWEANDVAPGTPIKVYFFLERLAKKDIRQIEKLNNTLLIENIRMETCVAPIENYKERLAHEYSIDIWEIGKYVRLRNDFGAFHYYLRRDEVIVLLDYVLFGLALPRRCAVVVFNCWRKGRGVASFGYLELLFVFEKIETQFVREVMKLQETVLLRDVRINPIFTDYESYERLLAGESRYYTNRLALTEIVLYDAFHRKRLKAPFIKKEKGLS